jgi:hypothetical protein
MSNDQAMIRIPSLTRLQRIELEKYLSPDEVKFEEPLEDDDGLPDFEAAGLVIARLLRRWGFEAPAVGLGTWPARPRAHPAWDRPIRGPRAHGALF